MEEILKISNVSKNFGKVKAVNNISFEVEEGETIAFIGPNGAGKTTTIKMMTGILFPDKGRNTQLDLRTKTVLPRCPR